MNLVQYTRPTDYPVSLTEVKLHLRVDISTDDELIKGLVASATDWAQKYERQSYIMQSYKLYLDKFTDVVELPFGPLIEVDSITYTDTNGTTQTLGTSYYTVDTYYLPGRFYLAYNQNWPTTREDLNVVCVTYKTGYATPFTANESTDVLTVDNAVFSDGDRVRLDTDQGDLPAGLSVNTDYYIRDVSGSTLKLAAASGGSAIDITDAGTGTHYIGFADRGTVPDRVKAAIKLIVGHLYEHREEVSEISSAVIPWGAKNLLMERMF